MCIYDESALPIGCICINQDITETLEVERALHNLNKYHGAGLSYDSTNISSVLDSLINDALTHQDVPPEQMDRAQRIEVVRYLDQHGAFIINAHSGATEYTPAACGVNCIIGFGIFLKWPYAVFLTQ